MAGQQVGRLGNQMAAATCTRMPALARFRADAAGFRAKSRKGAGRTELKAPGEIRCGAIRDNRLP